MRKNLALILLIAVLTACSTPPASQPAGPNPTASPTSLPGDMPCMVVGTPTSQGPILAAQFGDRGHETGPVDAPVTIVVFSDYQCTGCAYLAGVLKQIREAYPTDVRLIELPFPLSTNDKAVAAMQAAEAADLQGKYWEMHDLLYAKQSEWAKLAPADFPAWAEQQAAGLGLDPARFRSDYQGTVVAQRVKEAVASASGIQQSLPILFINSSTQYVGRADFYGLDQVVSLLVLTQHQFTACPPMIIDPLKQYLATLHTNQGDITIQLYADKAPLAVNNFVFLARSGWYDGIGFFRVIPGVLAQTGDPSETGLGNPGYYFASQIVPGLRFDRPGVVAMANNGPDTDGSQFFITRSAQAQMDGLYTIFGQVLSGMDVLARLAPRDPVPGKEAPITDDLISISITER